MPEVVCIIIGYLFGCFLTAEIVTRKILKKHCTELGSGNPGMANITTTMGVKWGSIVLLGDVLKTIVSCIICLLIYSSSLGRLSILYTGLGVILGHTFPFWNQWNGGRGVAVTCMTLVLYAPISGLISCILGLMSVIISGYLMIGAIIIPSVFLFPAFLIYGKEAGLLCLLITLLMISVNFSVLSEIADGKRKKTNLLKILHKKRTDGE